MFNSNFTAISLLWIALFPFSSVGRTQDSTTKPLGAADELALTGTELLKGREDFARTIVAGTDRFLLRHIEFARKSRGDYWSDFDEQKLSSGRDQLKMLLGLRDDRPEPTAMELVSTVGQSSRVAGNDRCTVHRVRWKAMDGIHGRGLLCEPTTPNGKNVIVIPDCEQTPEMLLSSDHVSRFVASGCRVVIPSLISRRVSQRRNAQLTDREYLYRSSFELGRQLAGYELQKVLSVVDWFCAEDGPVRASDPDAVGVVGWGEGGRLALYAGGIDQRIGTVCVSGYFGPREGIWQEPIDRNVFGLLTRYGDAEIAGLKQNGTWVIDASPGPQAELRTQGGAPYRLAVTTVADAEEESRRIPGERSGFVVLTSGKLPTVSTAAMYEFAQHLGFELAEPIEIELNAPWLRNTAGLQSNLARQDEQIEEVERFNASLLERSPYVRREFFRDHDVSSLESHDQTIESYRDYFRTKVVGQLNEELLPPSPRTRKVFDQPKWTGYEVVLDVFPDVIAYGILLLPKNLQPGERRPVIVCQHGLEGRPRNVIQDDHPAYHDYAAKLAERGFITFSPQNLYIFQDDFRTLQRKANATGHTLFSVMVPQHQQITDWLAGLPFVDDRRIAFYGLSYGGKSAMRIPPLVSRYCLSICSADFNDWVWKNASTQSPYSYVWTGEYEIFEWDLGSTFNYAEMAALIAPRPFMVERGHFDGVAPDERVALEFAKVRHLYQAKLGIGDRCEIEFFVGPHTIHGQGTFDFLHRHLDWPKEHQQAE